MARWNPSGRLQSVVLWALLLALFGMAASDISARPAWNLDGLFYSAASHVQTSGDIEAAHAKTYAEIKKAVPRKPAKALRSSSGYRRKVAADPDAMAGQLPFYSVKRIYVAAVSITRMFGVSGIEAAHFVSVVGFIGLCILFAAGVAARVRSRIVVLVASALFATTSSISETGTLASPDMLCAAFLFAAFLLCSSGRVALGATCSTFAILTRPDAVVFVIVAVLLPTAMCSSGGRRRALLIGSAVAVVVGVLPALFNEYGWTMVMRQTFIHTTTAVDTLRAPLTWTEYVLALKKGTSGWMATDTQGHVLFLTVGGVACLLGWLVHERRKPWNPIFLTAALTWVAAGLHILAFPLIADRVLLPAYVLSALALAVAADLVSIHFQRSVSDNEERAAG